MRIALYGRNLSEEIRATTQTLISALSKSDVEVVLHKNLAEASPGGIDLFGNGDELKNKTDILLSLGGDGTILDTVTMVRDTEIPVLGINLGRLGFLSSRSTDNLESTVEALTKKHFQIDRRCLLKVEANHPMFGKDNFGLNEFTLQRKDTSSMITIHTYLNGELLNSYWADGLILATPTGSTGYSLSCGGPIIYPSSKSLIITPVAPHNLNVRPIVVPDDSVLTFMVEGRGEQFLSTLDSRVEEISSDFEIAVRKAEFDFCLIRLDDSSFLNAIREKLLWGADKRN
jgi:NAD+ kinase